MRGMDIINIYENYNSYFNSDAKKHLKPVLEKLSNAADACGCKLFLIGGIVRDMLLDVESLDVDLTIEGRAIEFAKCLENENIAKISSVHEDFGTVKIIIDEQEIDIASTRKEIYPHAGHLPVIEEVGCSLKEDVLRRDFTINSLAMSMNKETFGDLIDYVGGFEDLKSKKLRILHEKSFIDDPTRIIRGLKYSTRLGFDLEDSTQKLQKVYLDNINYDMCYKRVKQEFIKTFSNANSTVFKKFLSQEIYKLFSREYLLLHPHPEFLTLEPRGEIQPSSLKGEGSITMHKIDNLFFKHPINHPWLVWFGLLFCGKDMSNFSFTKYEKEVLESAENILKKTFADDFELYKALSPQKLETLLILAILGKENEVTKYLKKFQHIKLQITGQDLIGLGYKPSIKFAEAFDYVLKTKIEKHPALTTKQDELNLAKEYLN